MDLQVTDKPDAGDLAAIERGLVAYNHTHCPVDIRPLAVVVKEDGVVIAGMSARTLWTWLDIKLLWVAEGHRGLGLGRAIMARAESEARGRGCRHALVDTFEFQALGFYRRLGYEVFGELADFPPGHRRFFLRKRFDDAGLTSPG